MANIFDGSPSTVWVTGKDSQRTRVALRSDEETVVQPGQPPEPPRARQGPPWPATPFGGGATNPPAPPIIPTATRTPIPPTRTPTLAPPPDIIR